MSVSKTLYSLICGQWLTSRLTLKHSNNLQNTGSQKHSRTAHSRTGRRAQEEERCLLSSRPLTNTTRAKECTHTAHTHNPIDDTQGLTKTVISLSQPRRIRNLR